MLILKRCLWLVLTLSACATQGNSSQTGSDHETADARPQTGTSETEVAGASPSAEPAGDAAPKYAPPTGYYAFDSLSVDLNADGATDKLLVLEPTSVRGVDNHAHFDTRIVVLRGTKTGEEVLWKEPKDTFLGSTGDCPADGYQQAVAKGTFLTIEQMVCDGWLFVQQYITFRYDDATDGLWLHQYGERYTDRRDPDQRIPEKTLKKAALPKLRFEDCSDEVFIGLRQKL